MLAGFLATFLVATTLASAAFNLRPAENRWVKVGQRTELKCEASKPVSSCSWSTPYDEDYPLKKGQTAEHGRLVSSSTDDAECSLVIENVADKDSGSWTCIVGVVDENEVTSAKGQASLQLATRPTNLRLDMKQANFSLANSQDIDCVVENANPGPKFSWYVGEARVETENEAEEISAGIWSQTMTYAPDQDHSDKELRCIIDHVGLEDGDERETGLAIHFVDEELVRVDKSIKSGQHKKRLQVFMAVTLCIVIALCVFIVVAHLKKWLCFRENPVVVANGDVNHACNDGDSNETTEEANTSEDARSEPARVGKDDDKEYQAGEESNVDGGEENAGEGKKSERIGDNSPLFLRLGGDKPKAGFAGFLARFFARRNPAPDVEACEENEKENGNEPEEKKEVVDDGEVSLHCD